MTDPWYYDDVEAPRPFPWPPPEGASALGALGETWKSAALEPTRFFEQLPRADGTGPAILYYLIIGILVAGAGLFWDVVGTMMGLEQESVLPDAPQFSPVVVFLLTPLLMLFGLVLSAGVTHVMLLVLRAAKHTFGTTLQTFCYAYSPMLLGVVPVLGTIIGGLWMLVLAVVGLAAAHGTDRWRTALAVVLPFVLMMGAFVMALLAVIATGGAVLAI
jgi:hypothetical protein